MEKLKAIIIKKSKWIIFFLCIIVFLVFAEEVFNKDMIILDEIGYKFISTHLISNFATPIVKIITNFGGATFLIFLTAVLFVIIKNKKIGASIIANLSFAAILNTLLKNVLQRPRPTEHRIIDESGYSFPSGHSMVSMAFYGFFIYLIYKYVKNKYLKWIVITILSLLICSIGISRIYLGVHYASDVLAGFLVAISYLIVYVSIIKNVLETEKR